MHTRVLYYIIIYRPLTVFSCILATPTRSEKLALENIIFFRPFPSAFFFAFILYTFSIHTLSRYIYFSRRRRPMRNKTPPPAVGPGRPRPRLGGGEGIKDGRRRAGRARAAISGLRTSTAAEATLCAECRNHNRSVFSTVPPPH